MTIEELLAELQRLEAWARDRDIVADSVTFEMEADGAGRIVIWNHYGTPEYQCAFASASGIEAALAKIVRGWETKP
jgi:hypothetical protein